MGELRLRGAPWRLGFTVGNLPFLPLYGLLTSDFDTVARVRSMVNSRSISARLIFKTLLHRLPSGLRSGVLEGVMKLRA